MNAESIKIESDEDGFHLIVKTSRTRFDFNIHGCAEALHEQVNLIIGGWLAEGEAAARTFRCNPDESGGYATDDPKHENFHSVHADIWDARDKTLAATENMDLLRQALEGK